jgi:hypothetical protein
VKEKVLLKRGSGWKRLTSGVELVSLAKGKEERNKWGVGSRRSRSREGEGPEEPVFSFGYVCLCRMAQCLVSLRALKICLDCYTSRENRTRRQAQQIPLEATLSILLPTASSIFFPAQRKHESIIMYRSTVSLAYAVARACSSRLIGFARRREDRLRPPLADHSSPSSQSTLSFFTYVRRSLMCIP